MTLAPSQLLKSGNLKAAATEIQETLDLYMDRRIAVRALRANECGRKLTAIKDKYSDLSLLERKHFSYIDTLLNTARRIGLPCGLCLSMISIGTKCVIKKGGRNTKTYHYHCARSVNII